MRLDVYFHNGDDGLMGKLDQILALVSALQTQGANMSQQLDDLKAAVAAEDTVIGGAITLLKGLSDQIVALKDDPAALQALADDVKARTQELSDAVTANTPAAP